SQGDGGSGCSSPISEPHSSELHGQGSQRRCQGGFPFMRTRLGFSPVVTMMHEHRQNPISCEEHFGRQPLLCFVSEEICHDGFIGLSSAIIPHGQIRTFKRGLAVRSCV